MSKCVLRSPDIRAVATVSGRQSGRVRGVQGEGPHLAFPSPSPSLTFMFPFTQEKRRKINLGGATSVSSQTDILHGAKARRSEREEIRRRHESALCIQSRWRSYQKYRVVKRILSEMFQEDVLGLNGMRALVLIGNDDSLLAQWSEGVIRVGDGKPSISVSIMYLCASHLPPGLGSTCATLPLATFSRVRRVSHYDVITSSIRLMVLPFTFRLVVTICRRTRPGPLDCACSTNGCPSSSLRRELATVRFSSAYRVHSHPDPYSIRAPASLNHLRILDKFLSPTSSAQALGARAEDLRIDISNYLLQHRFYPLLARALGNIVR